MKIILIFLIFLIMYSSAAPTQNSNDDEEPDDAQPSGKVLNPKPKETEDQKAQAAPNPQSTNAEASHEKTPAAGGDGNPPSKVVRPNSLPDKAETKGEVPISQAELQRIASLVKKNPELYKKLKGLIPEQTLDAAPSQSQQGDASPQQNIAQPNVPAQEPSSAITKKPRRQKRTPRPADASSNQQAPMSNAGDAPKTEQQVGPNPKSPNTETAAATSRDTPDGGTASVAAKSAESPKAQAPAAEGQPPAAEEPKRDPAVRKDAAPSADGVQAQPSPKETAVPESKTKEKDAAAAPAPADSASEPKITGNGNSIHTYVSLCNCLILYILVSCSCT